MFHVGQKVAAIINGTDHPDEPHILNLVRGQVYTIVALSTHFGTGRIGGRVAEADLPPEWWYFMEECFRPVVERKTDISVFQRMLRPTDRKVSENENA
jgi:hypothetical protein